MNVMRMLKKINLNDRKYKEEKLWGEKKLLSKREKKQ